MNAQTPPISDSAKLSTTFELVTTNRETGKTERRVFDTSEELIAALSEFCIHAYSDGGAA